MTSDEIWMREPLIQCEEEFQIYDEISELVFEKLEQMEAEFVVTEGAAYTPNIMKCRKMDYITMIPAPDFQIAHYKEREWVPYIWEGCSDKNQRKGYIYSMLYAILY